MSTIAIGSRVEITANGQYRGATGRVTNAVPKTPWMDGYLHVVLDEAVSARSKNGKRLLQAVKVHYSALKVVES
jgi:ribosomal protein L24